MKDLQQECQYQNYADAKCDSQNLSEQIFQKIEKTAWYGGTVILDLSVLLAVSLSLWLNFEVWEEYATRCSDVQAKTAIDKATSVEDCQAK